jgi:hypothetical protein
MVTCTVPEYIAVVSTSTQSGIVPTEVSLGGEVTHTEVGATVVTPPCVTEGNVTETVGWPGPEAGVTVIPVPCCVLMPVPVRLTICGLPEALSVMATAADSELSSEGVKVTLIAQVPFTASGLTQVLV